MIHARFIGKAGWGFSEKAFEFPRDVFRAASRQMNKSLRSFSEMLGLRNFTAGFFQPVRQGRRFISNGGGAFQEVKKIEQESVETRKGSSSGCHFINVFFQFFQLGGGKVILVDGR